jgi:hypothetical protein
MGGKTYEPEACERISKNLKHKLRQLLRNNEVFLRRHGYNEFNLIRSHQIKKYKTDESINLDDDDIEFIVHQVSTLIYPSKIVILFHYRCGNLDVQ